MYIYKYIHVECLITSNCEDKTTTARDIVDYDQKRWQHNSELTHPLNLTCRWFVKTIHIY